MSRVQLALNVSDVDAAAAFYEKVFGTPPAKRRPGYANFAITDPPLKLVLIENTGSGPLNHLGVEVEGTPEVNAATDRFVEEGLTTWAEQGVECCYARQDKAFVSDPDGTEWEFYTVLADSPVMQPDTTTAAACCDTEEPALQS